MSSINYFDIFVLIIFSFVSYSLYKTLKGEDSDIILSSSKPKNNEKLKKTVISTIALQPKSKKGKSNIVSVSLNGEGLDNLDTKVLQLMKMDKTFEPQSFMARAKLTFDNLFNSFYEKDLSKISSLITQEVFEKLNSSILSIKENNEDIKAEIIRFKSISLHDIKFSESAGKSSDSKVSIILDFQTEQSAVVLDRDKKVLRGDDNLIISMIDRLVFTRDFAVKDSIWQVSDIISAS